MGYKRNKRKIEFCMSHTMESECSKFQECSVVASFPLTNHEIISVTKKHENNDGVID